MPKQNGIFRALCLLLLLMYLQSTLIVSGVLAQGLDCGYGPAGPDLEHARQSFKALNYQCAEQEINDLLNNPNIDLELKANAHVLMAAVYYAKVRDTREKEKAVVDEFARAFRAYQDWQGDLDIKSSEFAAMMEKAKLMVEDEVAAKAAEPVVEEKPKEVPAVQEQKKGKPLYTKWWAIVLGVGLVAGVVALAGGGGGGTDNTLPDFPDTPTKQSPDSQSQPADETGK